MPDGQRNFLTLRLGEALAIAPGQEHAAQACLDESMAVGPSPKSTGLNLARQTKIALRTRRPDLAAEQIRILARVAPLVHSAKLNGYLAEVLARSADWRAVPELQEARRQLHSVMPAPPRSKK